MPIKKYNKIKEEVNTRKKKAKIRRFSKGSLADIQELIEDIYEKIENLNERVNLLELK